MSVELPDFPEIPKPPHVQKATKYNWSLYFNGNVHGVKEGDDFGISLRVFRQEARSHARRHGYELEMKSDLVNRVVYLRATKNGSQPKAPPKKPSARKPGPRPPKLLEVGRADNGTEAARVAPPPAPVDPVSVVFGDGSRMRNDTRPPAPRNVPGIQFGDGAKGEW